MPADIQPALEQMTLLLRIMARLREPGRGCPWDLQQDFRSIASHTLEETYEVIDAIERDDMEQLRGELGDLLFQVVFHARLGQEQGFFDFDTIAGEICTKLLRRHPHVFPAGRLQDDTDTAPAVSAEQVAASWESIKEAERAAKQDATPPSALDDVPLALGALQRAAKLQKRAAGQGFDWHDAAGVFDKLDEEQEELHAALRSGNQQDIEEEFGDLLFTMVNLGRHLKLDPETALRSASRKFEARFRQMEALCRADGHELKAADSGQLEHLWQQAKNA